MSSKKKSPLLSRSSPEPLYRQLATRLEMEIGRGLKPGDQLEPESALIARYGVSRITVRQAVDELVRLGILLRKQGKGTFVTRPTVRHDVRQPHGLFDSLIAQAPAARAELLRYTLAVPPSDIAEAMSLDAGEEALVLDRLYRIGDKPIGFAQSWLDPAVARIPKTRAEQISTEQLMRTTGIVVDEARISIRAETAGSTLSKLLRISPRAAVLVLRRRCIGADGAVKEMARLSVCPDSYEFVGSTRSGESGRSLESRFDIRAVEPA